MVNRIFFTGNAQGNVTNLAGGAASTTHLDYLPIYTSDNSATGNVGVGVILLGSAGGTTSLGTVTNIPKGAANGAQNQATLSTSSGALAPTRATRRSVTVANNDSTIVIYVGFGTVSAANGFILKPGQSISLDTTAAVNGIAASGSPVASYIETYD